MGYAKLRQRTANGNSQSRVLKPAKKNSHVVVWVGVPLLLLVAGAAAFGLVYMRNSKNGQSTGAYSYANSQMKSCADESMLSEREVRLRSSAKRLKDSGRCDSDKTARAAAEAKEAMRNLLR